MITAITCSSRELFIDDWLVDRRKNNGPAPNVQSAMDSDEDWENHEVGSLGVLVLGVLVRV